MFGKGGSYDFSQSYQTYEEYEKEFDVSKMKRKVVEKKASANIV